MTNTAQPTTPTTITPAKPPYPHGTIVAKDIDIIEKNKDAAAVTKAKNELASLGAPAVKELMRLSATSDDKRFNAIIDFLSESGQPFVKTIESFLVNANVNINTRYAAASSLAHLYSEDQIRELPAILNSAFSTNPEAKDLAAFMLSSRAKSDDYLGIVKALTDAPDKRVGYLTAALAQIGDEQSRDCLVQLVRTGKKNTQMHALDALVNSSGWGSLEDLRKIASDNPDAAIRQKAVAGLGTRANELTPGSVRHDETVKMLVEFINDEKNSVSAKCGALNNLAKLVRANTPAGKGILREISEQFVVAKVVTDHLDALLE